MIHSFIGSDDDGERNVTHTQFCVYVTLWCNCLGSGQLLWFCQIDSVDAMTTGYSGVLKIILITGLQMDSDGKWTILVQEAHKCAVIIAEPSLAHSLCMKKKYIKLFKKEKRNQIDGLEAAENHSLAFSLRASHQGDVK